MEPEALRIASIVVGSVIPLLVALVTKEVASSGLKGVLNALLAGITGALLVFIDEEALVWGKILITGFETFVISIATYYGVYKPTNTTQKVQSKTADVGIGGSGTI